MAHGLPEQIATDLCVLALDDLLERVPSLKAEYPIIPGQVLQTTAVNTPKTQISTGKPNPIDTASLRVGIQNCEPMNKEEMTKVHRHLILAIAEQWKDGGGPEFLEFKHMEGWIMVTCVDRRSKAWLLDELQYLEPWPESQLSLMPERKLPKLNIGKIVAFIPESEATSVQEALELLKAQNKGLNTEQWTLVDEKLESGKSWTVTFIIDEASLKSLEAQECRAAIGFTTMNFQIIPVADILIKSERSETSQEAPSSSATTANVAESVSSVPPRQGNKQISKEPSTLTATVTPILRANCGSRSVVQNSNSITTLITQNNSQGADTGMPPIGYIKHMLQDAKDRIEEIKQKRISDRRSRWGRWDEPPTARQKMLEAKNRNTAQPITEDLRRREETSTSATAQAFSAPTAVALDRNATGGITVIQQNFPVLPTPANLGGFSAHTTGTNPHMVSHSMEIPGFGVPNATPLGRIGTGVTVTVPQQNSFTAGSEVETNLGAFSAQVTGRNPNMVPHSMEIPGFGVPNVTTLSGTGTGSVRIPQQNGFTAGSEIGTNLNALSTQVTGRSLTMMPPNTVIPGFGVPNAATMGGSGIGGITQQNVFSAPASQTQDMDYFLGPGGGSQFVQNQMMSQNPVDYGGVPLGQNMSGDAAYPQNMALATMYPYSNPQYYMNCYQDSQAAMSMLNQDSGQQGPVAQLSRNNNGSERSKDSSPTEELSEEGYRSWIIEETKRFASNLEDHSSLASKRALSPTPSRPLPPTPSPPPPPIIGNYGSPMDQDPDRGSPFDQDSRGSYQDMHSRSYMERLSPQASDRHSPNYRRRSYDRDSISRFDTRQSPQAKSDRDSDIEDYESYKRSQTIREIKEEQVSPPHELRSPERRSGCRPQNTEDSESYESSWRSTEKSDRDVPSRPNRASPQSRRDYEDREIMEAIWSLMERSERSDRRSPQPRIDYRPRNIEDSESESDERTRSSREKRDDLDGSLRPERRSPQPMKDYTPRNIEGSENNERSRCNREETDDLNRSLKSSRRSPQPMKDYRLRHIENSETNERNRSSREERSLIPGRKSPQPMKDYRPQNIEGSEINQMSQTNREERDVLDKSLRPNRQSPQPRRDYTPRNIESSKTNQMSQINREERDVLDKSLRPDRKSPQPRRDYLPRNIEASETNQTSQINREESDVLDKSVRPNRQSPQLRLEDRPRNIEESEINEQRSREERDLDRPDRKSPHPRIDNRPRNIEGSEINQISQRNREERDVLDKFLRPDRKSPQPRRGFRPRKEEDVRDRSPRRHRRSPQPRRDNRPRIIESYETTRIRRERLIDRNRPRLNIPPPVRSGFRRENIQDSRARFQDRRREGPGTWNKGIPRPRERDGHVRDRSPVTSRSTARPREIRRPDMRPRR
ncbi:serine/arginine repetitive matrix protein 2-like [Cydia fagiglandana]|uniref:serine/arginine repetitive matrix protein 2-like n=1 Tax=Cydia fagiglandana TaxID=1458189 RepID=UPI002FEDF069